MLAAWRQISRLRQADPSVAFLARGAGFGLARWRTNVPTYARVRFARVYLGVDLVYYGNGGRLEHDFVVAPGADPRAIRLDGGVLYGSTGG